MPVAFEQADPNDPSLARNAQGDLIRQTIVAPDWQGAGEKHERTVAWTGTDQELATKLEAAVQAGRQINDAKLEYSPLYNNSNGVVGNLMKAAGVKPVLPIDTEGEPVKAPDFGEDLYQDVGLASNRSGYRFNGTQWHDEDDRKIAPPKSGQPVVPQDPGEPKRGSSDGFKLSAADQQPEDPLFSRCRRLASRPTVHLGWGSVTADKVVMVDQVPRVFVATDGFKPQLSPVAASSRSIYVLQRQLKAGHDSGRKAAIFPGPQTRRIGMFLTKQHLATARTLGLAIVATLGLGACATYDDDFARVNSRLDRLDTQVQGAAQSAEAANQSAQQANQRLDQIEGRVQQLEAAPRRAPRG